VALAGGAAVGAWIVTVWGYPAIFLCSAIGRMAAAILFIRFVPAMAESRNLIEKI